MGLNTDQVQAVNLCLDAYEAGQPGFSIIGEGGTGKTYSVMEIARILLMGELNIILCAPTNKAVKQLEKAARAAGLDMSRLGFKTLHSAMGLSLLPTAERKHAVSVRDSVFGDYDMIVCDEQSMLGEAVTLNYLLPELEKFKLFCLLMGDRFQLNPVGEKMSPSFGVFPSFELTKNERQKNNPDGSINQIQIEARALRAAIDAKLPFKFSPPPSQNIEVVKAADFIQEVLKSFTAETNLEDTRVLAWQNTRVDEINRAIRKKIYGPDAARFEIGEQVVTGGPIKANGDIVLSTDEECIVTAVKESTVTDEATGDIWKTWLLTLKPIYAEQRQIFAHVLHEDDALKFKEESKRLASKAEDAKKSDGNSGWHWKRFHDFNDLVSNIKYCYCITLHRSQGSTFKNGFVDVKDILQNPQPYERKSLFYVGLSRFQFHVCVNKANFLV